MESFSLDQASSSLVVDGFDPAEKLDWLEKSYVRSKDFFQGLLTSYHEKCGAAGKSQVFGQYDFYYDIFEKKHNFDDIAYIYYDSNNISREVTYKELKLLVDAKADKWSLCGAIHGQLICLVYNLCLDYVVGLLAALKLGLIVSFLSPSRPVLLKKQLRVLDPDFISTNATYALIINEFHEKIIENIFLDSNEDTHNTNERSWVFTNEQIVARVFDYSTDQLFEPVDVSCDELYLHSMRDGLLALDLRPGDIFAAPGFSYSETQPAMLLSVFLTGAAFLDIKPEIYQLSPGILNHYPINILGINSKFRDFIIQKQIDIFKSCRFWFRNPSKSTEYNNWYLFIKKTGIEQILTGVLKWHAQIGGVLFFSRKRRGLAVDNIMPSAGLDWSLSPLSGNDDMLSSESGTLSVCFCNIIKLSPYIVMKTMYEWLFLGSRFKEKQNKYYPMEFVCDLIRKTKICKYFFMFQTSLASSNSTSFDLIIFTGLTTGINYSTISDKINRKITMDMGTEYCPDRITFYPILPRLDAEGLADCEWCEAQYFSGGLSKKSRDDIYKGLSIVKKMVLEQV